jgi:glycosyltransferase involved in cell wall biosynthesis
MPQPLVSVVVPVFNAGAYLEQALGSICGQTINDFEVICVDDGSTDNSSVILESYRVRDARVSVITQSNKGAGVARNTGLERAQGMYLWFPDADDFYSSDLLEKALKNVEHNKSDVIVFKSQAYSEATGSTKVIDYAMNSDFLPRAAKSYRPLDMPAGLFQAFNGWAWDKIFRKQFVIEHGLRFQELRTTNDLLFTYQGIVLADILTIVRDVLATHRTDVSCSLEATRSASPVCSLEALAALRKWLIAKNVYFQTRRSFVNLAADHIVWNLSTLSQSARKQFASELRERYITDLDLKKWPNDYFYKSSYGELLQAVDPPAAFANIWCKLRRGLTGKMKCFRSSMVF